MNALIARRGGRIDAEQPTPPPPAGSGPDLRARSQTGREAEIEALIAYLWCSPEPPPLLHRVPALALSSPRGRDGFERPLRAAACPPVGTSPPGTLYLYSRFMVWTAAAAPPSLPRLGAGEYALLPAADRVRLARPLRAAGSLILKLEAVIDVRRVRRDGVPGIALLTPDHVISLGPAADGPAASATLATRWEPRLYELLRRHAAPAPTGSGLA